MARCCLVGVSFIIKTHDSTIFIIIFGKILMCWCFCGCASVTRLAPSVCPAQLPRACGWPAVLPARCFNYNAIFTTIFGITNALRFGNCVLAAHITPLICMHGCILRCTFFMHGCILKWTFFMHVACWRDMLACWVKYLSRDYLFTYRRLSSRKSMNKHYFRW